jgi:hypothetical protein
VGDVIYYDVMCVILSIFQYTFFHFPQILVWALVDSYILISVCVVYKASSPYQDCTVMHLICNLKHAVCSELHVILNHVHLCVHL